MPGLTPKQQRFVEEYLVDLNATQAAIRAGYSVRTAEQQGPRLLGNVGVASAIQAAKAERSRRTQIDADWVLRQLAAEKAADLADLFDEHGRMKPVAEWPEVFRRGVVVGVESFEEYAGRGQDREKIGMVRKVKLVDRTRHLELIGKHVDVQAWREKVEHTGPHGGPVQIVGMTADEFRRIAVELAAKI